MFTLPKHIRIWYNKFFQNKNLVPIRVTAIWPEESEHYPQAVNKAERAGGKRKLFEGGEAGMVCSLLVLSHTLLEWGNPSCRLNSVPHLAHIACLLVHGNQGTVENADLHPGLIQHIIKTQ